MRVLWYLLSAASAAASIPFFSTGWRRLNFRASRFSDDAFVGGDAYNYIINSEQAVAGFILGGIFIFCAMGFLIVGYLHGIQGMLANNSAAPTEEPSQPTPEKEELHGTSPEPCQDESNG